MRTDEELQHAWDTARPRMDESLRDIYNLGRKDVVDETSGELARMHADLAAERARHRSTAAALSDATTLAEERLAHANALQADIEAEQKGRLVIRRRFGARDSESMVAFVERLVVERETAGDDAALARRERDAEAAERIAANAALAAEKAAHEETRACLQRLSDDWVTVADAAGMHPISEARAIARAIVGSRRNLAAATDRIARTVLYARDRQAEPWAREVLAALGQPVAERGGEAKEPLCACGWVIPPRGECPSCGARAQVTPTPLTPDDVRRLAREVVAEAAAEVESMDTRYPFHHFVAALLRRGTP